ncbi:PepSY domain-containing protein [Hyphomonas beringensis]
MMRRLFFWTHFVMGAVAGVFILLMSVTGVLLTYERQIIHAAENSAVVAPEGADPMTVDALADASIAMGAEPGNTLVISKDRTDAVTLSKGRRDNTLLNPYTAETMPEAGEKTKAFFGRVMRIHRWLSFSGGRSELGGAINAAANLIFAGLLITGAVLWWPKTWKWAFVKTQLFFRKGLRTAQARDYNWHHVLAAWSLLPLIAIVVSGAVFSYGWANNLVYAAFGESPGRNGPPAVAEQEAQPSEIPTDFTAVSLETLLGQATADYKNWKRVSVILPEPAAETVTMTVDMGNGAQAGKKRTLTLAHDGSGVIGEPAGSDATPARKARIFLRFIHTGEVYGWIGQTIAGLASLAGVILVYTGISLGFRRLIRMRKQAKAKRA